MRLWIGLLLVLTSSAFAQQQEQITVNVVEVPVSVEGPRGSAVEGLTKDDFELFVNGSRQQIEYFDVLDEAPTAAQQSLGRRRLFVLLFDVGNSSAMAIRQGKIAASKFVSDAPSGDTFAVATIGGSGVRFVSPFTSDRMVAQRAIGTLSASAAQDPFKIAVAESERSAWGGTFAVERSIDLWTGTSMGSRANESNLPDNLNKSANAAKGLEGLEQELRNRSMIDHLARLADRLRPFTGIKHVVFMSELDLDGSSPVDGFLNAADRMHRHFRAAGVALDSVDLNAPRAPEPGMKPRLNPPGLFYTLSLETGGAVTSSLANLQRSQRITYVLGFHPRGSQKGRNKIRVRVKNVPWLTIVRYRPEYTTKPGQSDPGDGLLLADVLMNDIPQNGMSVELKVDAKPGGADLAARIPGRELLARPADKPLLLDVFFYVFDEHGAVAGWNYARVAIDLDKGREYLISHPYGVRAHFQLAPGRYAAKTLVRVVSEDITGFSRSVFELGGR